MIVSLLWMLVALQLCAFVHGLGMRNMEREQERVTMGPFSLKLAPTPVPFRDAALDSLYVYIQETLVDYMSSVKGSGWTVKYFVMTDIDVLETEGNVSTLRIGEGAAAFDVDSAADVPDVDRIQIMIRAAIETTLVDRLQTTEFYYVQQARVVTLPDAANSGGNGNDRPTSGIQDGGEFTAPQGGGGNGANAALTASVAVSGVAILLLAALLIRSNRRRHDITSEVHSPVSLETTRSSVAPPPMSSRAQSPPVPTRMSSIYAEEQASSPPQSPMRPPSRSDDARSLAESESSWTMATEMGDSAAVRSIASNLSQYSAPAVVAAESFEHERQVYLQKDMLTTQWSGHNVPAGALPTESVLQPSHFSPSQERQRKQWTDNDESPRPFIFASHDADMGEEVFLMPDDDFRGGPHSELL